jgi:hypothetical protein
MKKRILAYLFHLLAAALAVPMLTMVLSLPLLYWFVSFTSATNPQQFYSEHLLTLAITGLWLGYFTYETFPSMCALWIWIPLTLGFVVRVLSWRADGSVLFHSGIIEHFFVADCQIQNWHEPAFSSRCSDKLFVSPLIVGSLAYSAGAAICRARRGQLSGGANPTNPVPTHLRLVTTRFRAFLAVAVTGRMLAFGFHSGMTGGLSTWQWLGTGLFPTWAVVAINVAFWGVIFWMGIALALGSSRKDEKILLVAFVGIAILTLIGSLLPRIASGILFVQTLLSLGAFFAALAILISFWQDRVSAAT